MRVLSSFGIIAPAALPLCAPALHAQRFGNPDVLAPDFPSPEAVVEKMLELAKCTKKDVVYDLGCGDGRIPVTAARKSCSENCMKILRRGSIPRTMVRGRFLFPVPLSRRTTGRFTAQQHQSGTMAVKIR